MSSIFDSLSVSAGANLPRRTALRAMAATLGGVAAGLVGSPAGVAAQTQPGRRGDVGARGVRLLTRINNPSRGFGASEKPAVSIMTLGDRMAGRIRFDGQEERTLIPHILDSSGAVELSVYSLDRLDHRLTLTVPTVEPKTGSDISWVDVASSALPGVSFAALDLTELGVPLDYNAEADCCVTCCWGGWACACSVCCNVGDPLCGSCCDSGCCPACS